MYDADADEYNTNVSMDTNIEAISTNKFFKSSVLIVPWRAILVHTNDNVLS